MCWMSGQPSTASPVRHDYFSLSHLVSQSFCLVVIDLARLIVAFAPQSLHAKVGLGVKFMDALLRASDWEEHWTQPMTKAKERNILFTP